MDCSSSFKLWLRSQDYNPNTVRGYVSDVNKFLVFSLSQQTPASPPASSPNPSFVLPITNYQLLITVPRLTSYLTSASASPNYSRTLSSLRLFCRFAADQKLIKSDPFPKALRLTTPQPRPVILNDVIKLYQQHLEKKKKTHLTIKNYINDIQQFIYWTENLPAPDEA